ncbi:MAG: Oxidoreductase domain protein [Candidatus Uhrbacteria bacterium GW2011_GWF2_39_13]|uniref:Oxidoreductase domain protein n=1 Tax=Candidatus Uhrbacteria bacterium GW2011_GWF2_39_13 TaxID=1618995 RepID=A0A0G0QSX2_9BACT|nr:MAG: Oxidoreductase domain protein [Candidatus Uhrbacteria bacterium GW2011_GWF2_39_13]
MKILNTVLVGLGRIGWKYHLPEILKHKGFKLSSIVEPLKERRDEAFKLYGVKCFKDCVSLFSSGERPDLMVIASPTPFHMRQSLEAFKNGCDVFCDKPMALSYAEAAKIFQGMKKYKKKFMLYQPHRGTEEFLSLKHVLSLDLIGQIYMIKRISSGYNIRNDWQSLKKYGGGMLNNYGAHYMDQLLRLRPSNVTKVFCILRNVISAGDAEDLVKVLMETEEGLMLELEVNMASAHIMPPWQINGEYGSIILDREKKSWHVRYANKKDLCGIKLQKGVAALNREYSNGKDIKWNEKEFEISGFDKIDFYSKVYEHFALNMKPFVPIEETMELMRVFDLCRKSASKGKCISHVEIIKKTTQGVSK